MNTQTLVCALSWAVLVSSVSAEDWPQWQGPDRNAISKETGLLKEWPKEGPPLAWKTASLGGGDSAPSIAAGRIYGMANRGEDEVVWALSEKDGKEIWFTRLGPAYKQQTPQSKGGPACTPTVDGERLYVEGLAGNVACLQVADGKVLWQRSLTGEFGGRVPMWSYRESPLVDGDKVIFTPGSQEATLVALDKLTGKTIWKSQLPAASAGSSNSPAASPMGPSESGGAPGGSGGSGADSTTAVTGTKDPSLFQSEHFGMSAFSYKVPDGNYLAKLYFAETYSGITGVGQRVFSFNVQGREFKDFDIWVKAGGPNRAYIESVPVAVTNGELRIVFTAKVENPAIKAIEIIPQADAGTSAPSSTPAVRINAGVSAPFTDSIGQVWQADTGFEGGMVNPGVGGFGGTQGNRRGGAGGFGRGPGGFGGMGGSGVAYSSPIAIDFEGQRQYVQFVSKALFGVAASDGKFLWRYDKPANGMGINCTTPVYQDGMVFATSAYGGGCGLVKLSKSEDGGVKAEEVYASRKMQNHHGGMILLDGCLYGANGGNEGGTLACLDFKTGNVLWDARDSGQRRAKGSLALADGRLYYRLEDGSLVLVEPSSKQYIEHGRFSQPDRTDQPAWAHPVIANGKLYVRDQDTLYCYDVKSK